MAGSNIGADLWLSEYITPWDIYIHGVTNVLAYKKTAFQEMHIVETGAYGKGLMLDGKWQCCTGDECLYHEPLVHPAMISHGSPRHVLVLGGGDGATVREVLRWKSVEQVVMVDIDGEVVEACRQHLPELHQNSFDDPRTQLIIGDALEFLANSDQKWDVIISDLSDPIEEGPSFKLFTKEHFENVRRALSNKGQFVLQAGPTAPPLLPIYARVLNTLSSVFTHVHPFASFTPTYGEPWGFALCANEALETQPNPTQVDQLLQDKTTGGLQVIDGLALLGILQTPVFVRRAVAEETQVYTIKEPPKFFGKGTGGQ